WDPLCRPPPDGPPRPICTQLAARARRTRIWSAGPRTAPGTRRRVPRGSVMAKTPTAAPRKKKRGVGKEHWLYIAVIIAVVAGIAVGILAPEFGASLAWIGKGFVNLIKMMIAPVIFCTIVLGIGSIAKAATVGKVGG